MAIKLSKWSNSLGVWLHKYVVERTELAPVTTYSSDSLTPGISLSGRPKHAIFMLVASGLSLTLARKQFSKQPEQVTKGLLKE